MPSLPTFLLTTKLYRPPADATWVARPELLARLQAGLTRKLTLISAPPGFGKTTLVSQWLDGFRGRSSDHARQEDTSSNPPSKRQNQVAWLSLDEYDNDLVLFLRYLIAALQQRLPDACANSLQLLQAPQVPPVHHLAETLLHDLADLGQAFILVLDDYHAIGEELIHQLLTRVIEHLPRSIHLVLLSRTEPPLPLARWRVRGQLSELRAAELVFSAAETQTFLTQALGKPPAAEIVTALHERIEGWVAGLQLAALSLPAQREGLAFVRAFAGSNRYVMQYLLDEVFASQPPAVQHFLLRTSLLERFCASLCEVVIGDPRHAEQPLANPKTQMTNERAHAIVEHLVRSNLFVIPLDDRGEWYRYHHLFRDLLRRQLQSHLTADEMAALHRRASAWLAVNGLIEEALQAALAGGAGLTAAHLIEEQRHALLDQEDWRTLERWLALLPEGLVSQRPALLITQAFLANIQYKSAAIPALLQAAEARFAVEALPEASMLALRGEIDLLWGQIYAGADTIQRRLVYAQQALERLPTTRLFMHSLALFTLGINLYMRGQTDVAVRTLQAALEQHGGRPSTFTTRLLFALVRIHHMSGDFLRLHQTAQTYWQMATQAKLGISIGWSHCFLGIVHYEWNEVERATHYFSAVVDQRYSVHLFAVYTGWLGLAWTYQVQGHFDQARQAVEALLHFQREMHNAAFLASIHSFQARLALQQGDKASALRWLQTADLASLAAPLTFYELPYLTRAKILLMQATADSVAEASRVVSQLRAAAEAIHNTRRLSEILSVQALVTAAQGQMEQALAVLEQAVVLAKPGRFIRTFVDLGPPLAGLLYQLAARGVEPAYLGQLLAAFPPTPGAHDLTQRVRQANQTTLIEPLTERELEILLCLDKELSNKAIARTLNISPLTVKRHTTNLYQKLGVETRKQAVARARSLGILPGA